MAIDILFIIMVSFGFYFGYAYGLIRVALFVLSLLAAILAAMRFTPVTSQLIQDTFEVSSVFLPFVAFIITLVGVLLTARIMTRLFEEAIDNTRFNKISQVIGGLMMSLAFVFLYSVLITFFSSAKVIKPDSARRTSFFFKYIEKIPEQGQAFLERSTPFIGQFVEYMKLALQRLEEEEDLTPPVFRPNVKNTTPDPSNPVIDSLIQDIPQNVDPAFQADTTNQ